MSDKAFLISFSASAISALLCGLALFLWASKVTIMLVALLYMAALLMFYRKLSLHAEHTRTRTPLQPKNMLCACNSGKKYKDCCGAWSLR